MEFLQCHQKADGIANSVDPDHTAVQEQYDLGLHCFMQTCLDHKDSFFNVKANAVHFLLNMHLTTT